MKHRTIAIGLVTALLLFLMAWSFVSSAASGSNPATNASSEANGSGAAVQGEEEEAADPDLGKWGSRINRDEYLRRRDEYIGRKRGIEPGRPFDPEMRARAIDQMDRQESGRRIDSIVNGSLTPAAGGAWTALGPLTIPNGVGSNSGPVSGRVTAVVVDPTNKDKVYLGTAQGGVWRSLNGGTTWTSIFDNADSLAIGALAVAPSSPSTLYVGTGEFNSCGDCFFGVGLYRIDNADAAATLVGPINPSQTIGNLTYKVFNGRAITKILVHPTDPATIFVATARGVGGSGVNALGIVPTLATRGVYRSTNATSVASSVAFQKLVVTTNNSPDTPSTGSEDTPDMVMEPGNPSNILVTAIGPSGTGLLTGIYRTINATAATPTFTNVLTLPNNTRVSLAINKVAGVVTAYATTSETPNNTPGCTTANSGAVRKTTDPFGAGTWSGQLTGGGGFCYQQCFYDMPIAIDPNDANIVYIGGQATTDSTLPPPATCGGVVRKSTDGGNSFADDSSGLHADDHTLFIDPLTNTIFTGNDGGIWKRSSSVAAGSAWTNLNTAPLNTLQFESIAVHPTDRFLMIGGTQDNGTEYQQGSSGNWRRAEEGDGGYALIDQSATDTTDVTMYHTFYNLMNKQIGFDRIFKTACLPVFDSWPVRGVGFGPNDSRPVACDGGTLLVVPNGLQLTDNVLFYAPMALGPGSPNTFYFGTEKLYRSIDRGDTMTVVSQAPINSTPCDTNPTGPCPISSIAVSPQGDNTRMVGLQNGQVWATSIGSATLVNLTTPATSFSFPGNPTGGANKFVGRAVIDPTNKNVAYVTLSYFAPAGQGIWKITNLDAAAGASPATPVWTAAGNGIPSIPINALVIDPTNSNNLYAGTDIGVYSSTDGGANWAPFGTGLPRSAVFDLQIQPSNRLLRAATHGRGVWETSLVAAGPSTLQFSLSADSVTEGQVSKSITITRSGDMTTPASVNYATSDTSGANNCNVIGTAASARCDYIATSGTLNFAAGEASKNILVPIVDDSYKENAEIFTVTLSGASGSNVSLGSPATTTITITDNDPVGGGVNPIDTSSFFVRQHYIDFLNREPDTSGLNFWINNIDGCSPKPSCTEVQRINTSAAFFLSIEFQDTGYLVERIYKAAYGDGSGSSTFGVNPQPHQLPVPIIRLNEFLPDTQRIGQGVIVGVGNWQQQLESNKVAFTEEFVQRQRFLTDYPLTQTPAQFVDKLNQRAASSGVMPLSQAERDQLVSDLTGGTKTRAQVFRAVAEDQTLASAEFNRAFVLMQFFGYLRRNPNDPQDSDYTGYDFWLTKLNTFTVAGDDPLIRAQKAEMVKAFITSGEYRARFGTG